MMFISEKKLKALITAEVTKSTSELVLRVQEALDKQSLQGYEIPKEHIQEHREFKKLTEEYQKVHLHHITTAVKNECIQAEALTDIAALLRELLHRSLPKSKAKKLKSNA